MYDFAATEEDTVSVRVGERVVVAGEEDGEGWVEVWVEGAPARRGVVPAAYERGAWATALHDFAATDGETLSIGKGQRVVVVGEADGDGWASVHAEGSPERRGLVPASYIRRHR